MRYGRKERCVVCGGTGLVDGRGNSVVWLDSVTPPPRLHFCQACNSKGSVLYVWQGLRCIPLATLAHSKAHRAQLAL